MSAEVQAGFAKNANAQLTKISDAIAEESTTIVVDEVNITAKWTSVQAHLAVILQRATSSGFLLASMKAENNVAQAHTDLMLMQSKLTDALSYLELLSKDEQASRAILNDAKMSIKTIDEEEQRIPDLKESADDAATAAANAHAEAVNNAAGFTGDAAVAAAVARALAAKNEAAAAAAAFPGQITAIATQYAQASTASTNTAGLYDKIWGALADARQAVMELQKNLSEAMKSYYERASLESLVSSAASFAQEAKFYRLDAEYQKNMAESKVSSANSHAALLTPMVATAINQANTASAAAEHAKDPGTSRAAALVDASNAKTASDAVNTLQAAVDDNDSKMRKSLDEASIAMENARIDAQKATVAAFAAKMLRELVISRIIAGGKADWWNAIEVKGGTDANGNTVIGVNQSAQDANTDAFDAGALAASCKTKYDSFNQSNLMLQYQFGMARSKARAASEDAAVAAAAKP